MATREITIRHSEYRPCICKGRRAFFHRWVDSARPVKAYGAEENDPAQKFQLYSVHGLVEYEDGTMERVWPQDIQFLDGGYFRDYDWEKMEDRTQDNDAWNDGENRSCASCAHGAENTEFCSMAGYDCGKCQVLGCICKGCIDNDKWEAKE